MKINLTEYLKETVLKRPTKIAVIEGDISIDFSTLDLRAKRLADLIIQKCNCINLPVGIYLPKSIDAVVADIAITYSGNILMNLDIKTPTERIKNIITTIEPRAIISNSQQIKVIAGIIPDNIVVINLDELDSNIRIDEGTLCKRLEKLIDTDPFCIINTSGSTGTPKGVVLNHRSFFDFTEWANSTLNVEENEIIGSLSPIIFDLYIYELCMLMSKGSTIVILPDNLSAFPVKILEIMKNQKVSFILWVPTIMVNIANMDLLSKFDLPNLKKVWFAGEVLPTKQYNYWYKYLPQATFVNLYGPIEITVICSYYIVNRKFEDIEPLPIGIPCRNTSILLLNENHHLCIQGQEGEICVRGTSLAMGYYNNPEKTASAFIQNPTNSNFPELIYKTGDIAMINDNGEMIFRGRQDSLVKHLGYRIELGEIEHIIVNTLNLVSNGCVIYNHEGKEITLFYESDSEVTSVEFRRTLGEILPKYMIPTKYFRLEKMPMNANGKIDRLLLNQKVNG